MNPDKHHAFRPRRITLQNDPDVLDTRPGVMSQEHMMLDRSFWPCDTCGGSRELAIHTQPVRYRYNRYGELAGYSMFQSMIPPRRKPATAAVLALREV